MLLFVRFMLQTLESFLGPSTAFLISDLPALTSILLSISSSDDSNAAVAPSLALALPLLLLCANLDASLVCLMLASFAIQPPFRTRISSSAWDNGKHWSRLNLR